MRVLREHRERVADERRRAAVAMLAGVAALDLGVIALRQLGVVRHLPDPPVRGAESDRVVMSKAAFPLGIPDAPVGMASMLVTLALVQRRDAECAERRAWIAIATAAKTAVDAGVALRYARVQLRRERAWCAWCFAGAALTVAIAGLALPEAIHAVRALARERAGNAATARDSGARDVRTQRGRHT